MDDKSSGSIWFREEVHVHSPSLGAARLKRAIYLEADASSRGLGAVLLQNQRPIAFYSQGLTPRARTKDVQSEMLAMKSDLGILKEDATRQPAIEKALQLIATQVHHVDPREMGESSAVSVDLNRRAVDGDATRTDLVPDRQDPQVTSIPFGSHDVHGSFDPLLGHDFRPPRLDLPLFSEENPEGWVYQAELYFLLSRIPENLMLEIAVIALEGDALTWFQWKNQRHRITTWATLKTLLLSRFRAQPVGSLPEEFLSIRQESTVREYRLRWEALASRLPDTPEHILEGNFVKG